MHLLWHIYTVSCTIIHFHAWISRAILCNLPADFPACCSSICDCIECLNAIVLCLLVRQSYISNCKYSESQLHVYRSLACTLYMYIVAFVPSIQWNRNGIHVSVRHINDFLFKYRRHKLLQKPTSYNLPLSFAKYRVCANKTLDQENLHSGTFHNVHVYLNVVSDNLYQ